MRGRKTSPRLVERNLPTARSNTRSPNGETLEESWSRRSQWRHLDTETAPDRTAKDALLGMSDSAPVAPIA